MQSLEIKNVGIYHSKIAQPHIQMSNDRTTALFELELPLENGGISYINSESMPITPQLLICAKPNQKRRTLFPFRCSYAHIAVFNKNLYDALSSIPDFVAVKNHGVYEEIFQELQRYSVEKSTYYEIMKESLILKLIYMLCTETEGNRVTPKYDESVNTATDFIEKNLSADLKLENVAKQVAMSPIHFHNCFKKATGRTLHEYVEEKRISKAIHFMLSTNMTLAEIAYTCGFSSQSYFNYVFKRKMNMTPRKYIKSLMNQYAV